MINVVHLTDTHLFADPRVLLRGFNTWETLDAVVAAVRGSAPNWDVTLVTGDLVHDDSIQGYNNVAAALNQLEGPVYYAPGNHDAPATLRNVLPNSAQSQVFQARHGNWLFLILDSTVPGELGGHIASDQLEQILDLAAGEVDKHVLLAVHHHPVTVNSPWLDQLRMKNGTQVLTKLSQLPNIKAMVFGHIHQSYDGWFNRIRLLGTPSTCFQFRPHCDELAIDEAPPAFRRIRLLDDGSVETEVHNVHCGAHVTGLALHATTPDIVTLPAACA